MPDLFPRDFDGKKDCREWIPAVSYFGPKFDFDDEFPSDDSVANLPEEMQKWIAFGIPFLSRNSS